MKLVIGGYAQGKLRYVLKEYKEAQCLVLEGSLPGEQELKSGKILVINHLNLLVREALSRGENPEEWLETLADLQQECIVISDETGNGIVPMDAFEREYRDRMGRILIGLAEWADEVVRVICGIGQKIK